MYSLEKFSWRWFLGGVVILAIFAMIGFLIWPSPVAEPVVDNQQPEWKTYQSEKYGFEIQYPADWLAAESAENEIPRFVVYKEGDAPRSHHDNATQVIIFPQGLGTEGPFGQSQTVQKDLTGADENIVQEFYLADGQVRGYYVNFNNEPAAFEGYAWGGVKVENMTTEEIPLPDGQEGYPQIKVSGNVNTQDLEIVNQILATFKFTQTNEVSGWKTYANDAYGFEFQHPGKYNIASHRSDPMDDTEVLVFDDASGYYPVRLYVGNKNNGLLDEVINPDSETIIESGERTVSGVVWKMKISESVPIEGRGTYSKTLILYTEKNNNIYLVAASLGNDISDENELTAEQILSTFKFTK